MLLLIIFAVFEGIFNFRWFTVLFFCPPDRMIGGGHIVFVLFVCLLSTLNICYNFWTVGDRGYMYIIIIWQAYSTNDALSNDTKVNDLVTLTLTFTLVFRFPTFFAGLLTTRPSWRNFLLCVELMIRRSGVGNLETMKWKGVVWFAIPH